MYKVKWISTNNDEINERVFGAESADEAINIAKSIWCMLSKKEKRQHRIIAGEVDKKGEFIKVIKDF